MMMAVYRKAVAHFDCSHMHYAALLRKKTRERALGTYGLDSSSDVDRKFGIDGVVVRLA